MAWYVILDEDHTAAADPHPGYQLRTEKSAASGYASLDGSALVPRGEQTQGPDRVYRVAGTPESSVTAAVGSVAMDTTNGHVYVKLTGAGNTGWKRLGRAEEIITDHGGLTGLGDDDHPQYLLRTEWQWYPSVRAAFVVALTGTRTGDVLEATANGVLADADGITLVAGEIVAVCFQGVASNSGIYTVTDVGSAGTHWVLTRRSFEDGGTVLAAGTSWKIREGTTMGGKTISIKSEVTVNTSSWTFVTPKGQLLKRTRYVTGTTGAPFSHTYHKFTETVDYDLQGAGGGGHYAISSAGQASAGGGGGSGGRIRFRITITPGAAPATLDVGTAGTGGNGGTPTAPTVGGDTTALNVATTYRAKGGGIGSTMATGTVIAFVAGGLAQAGGTAEGSEERLVEVGRDGFSGMRLNGGNAIGGRGADSGFGGGGAPGFNAPGAAGTGHGSGGGGGASIGAANANGAAGTDGFIEVEEYT